MANNDVYIASRVSQLDAEVLDTEVDSILRAQVNKVFDYLHAISPIFRSLQPEIEVMIKWYLFRHTVFNNGASSGQQMLNLKLFSSKNSSGLSVNASTAQLLGLGFITVGLPYFLERLQHFVAPNHVRRIETTLNGLNLLNFLIFLTNGQHRSIKERILGIKCGYDSIASAFNPINYDYMSREILWFTFAEFMSFTLPLVNVTKIKNTFKRILNRTKSDVVMMSPGIRSKSDLLKCALCQESPVNVREIGCNHVFCYYCVMSTVLADESSGITCPECNFTTQNKLDIREVYMKGF